MTTIIDGSLGITFPSGSGTQAAQSKVLQVVSYTATGNTGSTTSSTYTATTITQAITPLFNTSKIFVLLNCSMYTTATAQNGYFAIYRGGSSVSATTAVYSGASGLLISGSLSYLDSPATTSSTTYTIYFKTNGGTIYYNPSGTDQISLTLMEIAA